MQSFYWRAIARDIEPPHSSSVLNSIDKMRIFIDWWISRFSYFTHAYSRIWRAILSIILLQCTPRIDNFAIHKEIVTLITHHIHIIFAPLRGLFCLSIERYLWVAGIVIETRACREWAHLLPDIWISFIGFSAREVLSIYSLAGLGVSSITLDFASLAGIIRLPLPCRRRSHF